jgi:transcription termination factor Rho
MYDILELSKKLLPELRDIAKGLKVKRAESLKKQDLIYRILDQQALQASEPAQSPQPLPFQPEKENEILSGNKLHREAILLLGEAEGQGRPNL